MIDPIKLCCGHHASEHNGPQCPDGKVMCCLCFMRFPVDQLATDPMDGKKVDVCQPCWVNDMMRMKARERQTESPAGAGPSAPEEVAPDADV